MMKIRVSTVFLTILLVQTMVSCQINQDKSSSVESTEPSIFKLEVLSISQVLRENNHLPVEERIALYHRLKKESPDAYNFDDEGELNIYGYSLLWDYKIKEAMAIFKLNVEQFPNSSNVYDSLGEAYLKNDEKEKSLVNYKKSLELDPDNFNAEDQIDLIQNPNKIQETLSDKFAKVYTVKEYKDDLEQLAKTLTTVHPNALKFISKENFTKLVEEKKALITEKTTYSEFTWHCNEIIASVNCSHTSTGGFYNEWEALPILLRFPLETQWVNNQLFVIDNDNNENKVAIKDEILTINGIAVSTLVKDIYKHIPSQGYIETSKKYTFSQWGTMMIPYELNFPKTYEIKVKGKKSSIILNAPELMPSSFEEPFNKPCPDNLCFNVLKGNKTAILTISSFNYYRWNNFEVFTHFIDKTFKEIKKKGVENLIIDVRFNGGGSPESSIYLLKYLIDEPFTYFENTDYPAGKGIQYPFNEGFKGKLYFIMDGNGNSTTGHFMSIAKDLKLGTMVGEELGSNQFCTGGQKTCRLSNTKLLYYVGNATSKTTVSSLPDEQGILPDHHVTLSIDDYLNNFDAVKDFTIQLIEK